MIENEMKGENCYVIFTKAKFDPGNQEHLFKKAKLSKHLKKVIPNHAECWMLDVENCIEPVLNTLNNELPLLANAVKNLLNNQLNAIDEILLKRYEAVLKTDIFCVRGSNISFTGTFKSLEISNDEYLDDRQKLFNLLFTGKNAPDKDTERIR